MKENYLRISSLDVESEIMSSHKRSKSSSSYSIRTSRNNENERKNYYKHEDKIFEENIKQNNKIKKREGDDYNMIKNKNAKKSNSSDIDENESLNFSLNSYNRNCDKDSSSYNSVNIYKISNNTSNDNKLREYVDKAKYDAVKVKNKELKEKHNNVARQEKNWRSSYFNLLKDSIQYDETIKNLMEENRIHQEYIISLENKLNKLLTSCNNITTNFHNNIMQLSHLENTSSNNNNITNTLLKNYDDIINDYKQQIEILAEEKESLSTNLSISRHQQLQNTLKLEEMQNRILFLDQARLEDMRVLRKIKKESES